MITGKIKKYLNSFLPCLYEYQAYPSYTIQPVYNMVHYNTVLDITRFKDGSQKCIDYIEK